MMTARNFPRLTTATHDVNGARLYVEVRGHGPPLLLVAGATGDAGHFERIVDALAAERTVITYDRRGNSRSSRRADWTRTSIAEQADDAAALLAALDAAPAIVFGTSLGAAIALELLLRHPGAVRGALLHEPPLVGVVSEAEAQLADLQPLFEAGVASGGAPAAMEAFVRAAAGPAFDAIPPGVRMRMLGNGATFFGAELDALGAYVPDEAALARVAAPVQLMVAAETTPLFQSSIAWLSARLPGAAVVRCPGSHTPYFDHPAELAAMIGRAAREVV